MSTQPAPRIALALSGGGIRAIAFHMGVLRLLAERRLLENVRRISSVSGGSLLVGLMLHENALRWPSSEKFLSSVAPTLRSKLCDRSMQWGAVRQLLLPWNWRFILSRANLLALALKHEWGVSTRLGALPEEPEWSINGTTAENGKRFRFKKDKVGDYELGYADAERFPLSSAMAVSAAFPVGFGPLTLDAARFEWRKRPWGAPLVTERVVDIGYRQLHLYDGGVYDNLGMEPLFDAGRGVAKNAGEIILVSDAGAPLRPGFSLFALNPWRLKRVADIMSEQARALRVRAFSNFLQQGPERGAYLYINTPVTGATPCASQTFASSFPTTLRRPTRDEFDALIEHGYRVARHVESRYGLLGAPASVDARA
jgi:NTE family protein